MQWCGWNGRCRNRSSSLIKPIIRPRCLRVIRRRQERCELNRIWPATYSTKRPVPCSLATGGKSYTKQPERESRTANELSSLDIGYWWHSPLYYSARHECGYTKEQIFVQSLVHRAYKKFSMLRTWDRKLVWYRRCRWWHSCWDKAAMKIWCTPIIASFTRKYGWHGNIEATAHLFYIMNLCRRNQESSCYCRACPVRWPKIHWQMRSRSSQVT